MSEKITITKKLYDYLVERDKHLTQLEEAGVDNWDGYFGPDDEEEYDEDEDEEDEQ